VSLWLTGATNFFLSEAPLQTVAEPPFFITTPSGKPKAYRYVLWQSHDRLAQLPHFFRGSFSSRIAVL